jgi:hypothetical protein
MRWRLACVASGVVCACGGLTDLSGTSDAGDASATDAHVKKDSSVVDTGTPYTPQGKACVATDAGAPTAWAPDPEAGAPLRPPVMQSSGGPVLANPVFVPMTFDGDDMRNEIEDFIASIGCTTYWHSIVPDYGVGDGITATPVHMSDPIPSSIDDANIGAFIRGKILAKTIPDAVPNQTLYVIFYPDTTDITLQGQHSCQSFGGYHNEFQMADGRRVPYAVLPRCGSFGQLGGVDELTATTSHELVEAVSDPLPMSNPAFQFPELNGLAWALAGGGEIGDLCEFNADAFFLPTDYPFYVQHSWASHAAYLAQNPCQPSTDVYFAGAPVLTDQVTFDFGSGPQTTQGIKIALGNNQTIGVKLIASGAFTDPITVSAHDGAQFFGGKAVLSFNWAATTGNVGDTLQLTVSRSGTNAQFNLEPFTIRASANGVTHSWWVVVGDP